MLLVVLIILANLAYTQEHALNWYFGTQAGLSFKTYPPTTLTDGAIVQREGNATISDKEGNLLFYSNGSVVWNKKHQKMKNGTGLMGQQIAAQSCIIAQQPKHPNIYYLFTVSDWQNNSGSLSYSIIDMSKENGLGEVVVKNTLMNSKCREQISAVYANPQGDVWILSHEKNTDFFVNYKLTEDGISASPVRSKVGTVFSGKNRYGQLKFSADGTKVCSSLGGDPKNNVQLYDFDQETGKLSNAKIIVKEGVFDAYSSEFSPNGKVLYVSSFNKSDLFQFDLSLNSEKAIQKSKYNLSKDSDVKSCLQIGYDHKIYVSKNNQSEIGVINNPNNLKDGCSYDNSGVILPPGSKCRLGFPNFIQSYFKTYRLLEEPITEKPPRKDTLEVIKEVEDVLKEQDFTIYFESGSSRINSASQKTLDAVAKIIQQNPGYKVEISSHTDCVGNAENNLRLSQKRANASANYLNDKLGVKNNTGKGYGENNPLTNCACSTCTATEHSKNRRTEIKLVPIK